MIAEFLALVTGIGNTLLGAVPALIVLGFLIFVHELGHFLAARKVGVHVEVFSLGFGPRLFGFKKHGTDYRHQRPRRHTKPTSPSRPITVSASVLGSGTSTI